MLRLLARKIGHIGHGFQKTVNHREWRAQFVRHIGHKCGAGGVELLGLADVAGNQQQLIGLKRCARNQQRALADATVFGQGDFDFGGVFQRLIEKIKKLGLAHDIAQNAVPVGGRVQIQMQHCQMVHPADAPAFIENQNAVGNGFGGTVEALQGRAQLLFALFAAFGLAQKRVENR